MRKIILIIGILLFYSCEDVVDVDLTESPPRLVIDASIEKQFSQKGGLLQEVALVNLSLTTPFFSEERKFVDSATVTLTEMESNTEFKFSSLNDSGNYQILDANFRIKSDVDYKLTVVYNGETYESIERKTFSTPFTLIEQKKNNNGLDEDGIAVDISFNDLEEEDSFYFLDLGDTNFVGFGDEFYVNGGEIRFTYFFDENATLEHLFKIYGSTKRFNSYLDAINELSNGDSNGPFGTVPFKAKGNIINKTNPENFPFGYFRVSEMYFWPITFVPNRDFKEPLKP